MQKDEIVSGGRDSKHVDRIIELLNAGSKKEYLGFRLITRNRDVILRVERDNSKKNPIEYLVVSLSEEFFGLFGGVIDVWFDDSDKLSVIAFSQAEIGQRFKKVGNRYNLKLGTSGLPAVGNSINIMYEINGRVRKNQIVNVKRPKEKV